MLSNNLNIIISNINRFKITPNSSSFYFTNKFTSVSNRTDQDIRRIRGQCVSLIIEERFDDAKECFDKVLANISEKDSQIFATMIRISSKKGHFQFTKDIIDSVLKSGVFINGNTRIDIIKGFIRVGDSKRAKEFIGKLFKDTFIHPKKFATLIHTATFSNNLEIAELVFREFQIRELKLNNSILLDMITLYIKSDNLQKAKIYKSQLDTKKVMDPNQLEYLIGVAARADHIDIMEPFFDYITIDSNSKLLGLVCCAYLRANDLSKAMEYFDKMIRSNRYIDETSLLFIFETSVKNNHFKFIDQVIETLKSMGERLTLRNLKGILVPLFYRDIEKFEKYLSLAKDQDNKEELKSYPKIIADKILLN